MAMDPPSPFIFPARDAQPLQNLSPERVNGSRPLSTISNMTSKSSTKDSEDVENPSPRGSPVRKANLFADYNPQRSPTKESAFGAGLPTSPSLPEMHAFRSHVRTNSDVQGLVKRFEHLDVRDRDAEIKERNKRHELELRRAQIAREEAESDVRRLREENRRQKRELDESHDRERKLGKRIEVVTGEFATFKESHATQVSVLEKEVRKSKKESFKLQSVVLKIQEELQSERKTLRVAQVNLDQEKRKVQQKEQDSFEAQYQLIAVQEELDKLRTQMEAVQEEKEALKTSLREEEVARIAAEGMIALPAASQDDDDLMGTPRSQSPRKGFASPLSDDKENVGVVTKKMVESRRLQEELSREIMRREHAEELADFLRMECRFRCCECRPSKTSHRKSLHLSLAFSDALESIRAGMRDVLSPPDSAFGDVDEPATKLEPKDNCREQANLPAQKPEGTHSTVEQLDRSVTMTEESSEQRHVPEHAVIDDEDIADAEASYAPRPTPIQLEEQPDATLTESTTKVPLLPSSPQTPSQAPPPTPYHSNIRTITTTTTIPMHFTPSKPVFSFDHREHDAETIPPTIMSPPRDRSGSAPAFDREAALAAIAYRRGRAKSIAEGHVTPRKQMIDGARRDISAPALGQGKTAGAGVSAVKGPSSTGRGVTGSGRRLH